MNMRSESGKYEAPSMEIIGFDMEDVVRTSMTVEEDQSGKWGVLF